MKRSPILLAASALLAGALAFAQAPTGALTLTPIGGYDHGGFDEGAAEIAAFDPGSARLFVVNSEAVTLDVLDLSDPASPALVTQLDMTRYGDGANSVAAHDGRIAVAIEAEETGAAGAILLADVDGEVLATYPAGALPDMVAFSPDGRRIVAANEGEPSDDYAVDPEGSFTIVDLPAGEDPAGATVRQVSFQAAYDRHADLLRAAGVRIFGPGASTAQDLEPEYVAIAPDGSTAFVSLQENNALARVDLEAGRVTGILPLGEKDWAGAGLELDVSDRDGIAFGTWPVVGLYQPDAIATFEVGGSTYVVSANEGDARDYDTYSEEARVEDLELDRTVFPEAEALRAEAALGRFEVTTADGDDDGDGLYERIVGYGGRSISVWSADGELVWDSGDRIEKAVVATYPALHNADNDESAAASLDSRSDAKGPEPEGVVVGSVGGVPYAFVGLERVGGVMVWDLSDPAAPVLVAYRNDRPFSAAPDGESAGDLGPEGLVFVAAEDAPGGVPLLIVAHEVTGTTRVFEVGAD
jgi:DNA-binding beta-propeller fold protein YncE